ncbi:MAG TPA: sodium-translocating pyrophosphatase [Actinomycetota bacterium]|nr:sodium-translocating pyrophosphatase [Actinomycetota bacterium]
MPIVLAQEGGRIEATFRSLENNALWVILGVSFLALAVAYVLVKSVLSASEGTPKMIEIAKAIQEGARAYLQRQFKTLGIFLGLLVVFLFFVLPVPDVAENVGWVHSETGLRFGRSIAFIFGAAFSAITGFVGMSLAVRANVRVANAARESGLRRALTIAFRAGGVAGMFTVGLGLLGATVVLMIYKADAAQVLVGFGFGGALLAMFMRVGGGIFTKAADVGADLVGKVEKGIPEDDPRNAATIADNVGDNVGDCAGMAADLFESYEVTLVASIILGAAAFTSGGNTQFAILGVMFPLFVRAIGVITSIIGIYMVRPRSEEEHGMKAINRGFFVSAALSAFAVFFVAKYYVQTDAHPNGDLRVFWAVVIGLVLSSVIQILTEHYTSTTRNPVKEVAEASQTGPATTILSGFSVGMESTVWSLLAVAGAIIGAFALGDSISERLYFISLVGMGMLTTVGVIVSMDTYGPISDNAQGIAEMSGEFEGRPAEILTGLDAVGNSTKAITKGMAIATAVIAATSLFGSFREILIENDAWPGGIRIDQPDVLVGLLIGGAVAFLFAALAIRAVGRAAGQVVVEVRKQFREHPGIMDYTEKPDYGSVVDICTKTSLRELMTPGLLAVITPIAVGFALQAEALGAYLGGVILTGQLLAVMLSNSGGAWDNAKKLVEEGKYGGKGSEEHKATVIGDTVGDPFKDTAGPALNPLIKVMNLVALLIAPMIVQNVDNNGLRIGIPIVGVVILGAAIAYSKRRRTEELVPSTEPATAAATK